MCIQELTENIGTCQTGGIDKSGRLKCKCNHSIYFHMYIDKFEQKCGVKNCKCKQFREVK